MAPEAPFGGRPGTQRPSLEDLQLPESYGTGRLFLTARDPHWLYAWWDLSPEHQRRCNAASREGHLVVRVFAGDGREPVVPEVHVHPESKNWFVHVPHAETKYHAILGYYDPSGRWHEVSRSRSTLTPPDAPTTHGEVEFATVPLEVTFERLQEVVQEVVSENIPLVEAILRAEPQLRLEEVPPPLRPEPPPQAAARAEAEKSWTPLQATQITRMVMMDEQRRVWIGSVEITELIRRRLEEEISSVAAAKLAQAPPPGAARPEMGISSPLGPEEQRGRKFWFNVNAELIVYGATERDATLTIGGRPVRLRPDGSFSFRFSLPDGKYQLPVVAISGDGEEGREARLQFSRASDYSGDVEAHPQGAALKAPHPENL